MVVQIGDVYKTDNDTYTVIAVNGRHARVRYGRPRIHTLTARERKAGGYGADVKQVLEREGDMHVNTLADMDRVGV